MVEGNAETLEQYNLFHPEVLVDPYPAYRRLQTEAPVHWNGFTWIVTRYADVLAALRDPRFGADRINPNPEWLRQQGILDLELLFRIHAKMMLFSDPPDHTRLRSLVNKAFTSRAVEGMRTHIQQIVHDLLDRVQPNGQMDIIEDLAYPLPVTVIAEMLGVPIERREQFKHWSDCIAAFIGGTTVAQQDVLGQALQSVLEMKEYFLSVAAERRTSPRNDLLSALALAEEQGDRLSGEELVANSVLLLVAGHETTTNLIGNGMLALLCHRDQMQRLKDNPALIENAVEEMLRYDSPVQGTSRIAKVDLELDGRPIKAGQHISLMIGAANRDPAQFSEPDRFDIERRGVRHLSFSHGPHFCLGAQLARLEGRIAIDTLIRRIPDMQLASETLEWRDNYTLRGLKALLVRF